ncbi:ROK family protein [Pseudobacter ginsenosidimutans]|jgi:glucokinase|uniref:Glucokinase n=1 Tax=Pseudobacter ginsenosidimutans TaxID=661488 RepID=A0A4Q7MNH9_9BACT|nr:ROK family protein [Pseudobacter ginsenosidimutans]RZS69138.1 glucokinase [Pseudobacter ginsenosidimutans]
MYRIGIDLGGTLIKAGLMYNGQVKAFEIFEANAGNGVKGNLPLIESAVNALMAGSKVLPDQLGGVGLAFPGLVDPVRNAVISTNQKYDDAFDVDFNAWAESNWNVPFCMDNDARLAMIGEWQYGAARGHQNVVMLTIGTGIGTGVVLEGKVLYGQHFQAGSLGGHFVVDYKGRTCSCGNRGCVEALASSAFLPAIIQEHPGLSAAFKARAKEYDFKQIFALAGEGDVEAIALRNNCMDIWAAALVNCIHAYDPSIIVLGGGILKSSEVILPYLQERVGRLAWCPSGHVEIVNAASGDQAALLGIEYRLIKQYQSVNK